MWTFDPFNPLCFMLILLTLSAWLLNMKDKLIIPFIGNQPKLKPYIKGPVKRVTDMILICRAIKKCTSKRLFIRIFKIFNGYECFHFYLYNCCHIWKWYCSWDTSKQIDIFMYLSWLFCDIISICNIICLLMCRQL